MERLALFQIAKRLPPAARALEIGSHVGSSALFICAGLEHVGGHLICVDTWMNQTMPDGAKDTFKEFKANTLPFGHMITPIRKFSHELSAADIGGPLDLVFIDGDHSEDAVRHDFETASAWVKPAGIVAFHDVGPSFPGVSVVLGEALASGKWLLSGYVHRLAWIRKFG